MMLRDGLDAKWKRTIDDALTNPVWDYYDPTITREINDYNSRFATSPGYLPINAKVGTTMEVLQTMNPSARGAIQPKRVLTYKKASIKLVITGWTPSQR